MNRWLVGRGTENQNSRPARIQTLVRPTRSLVTIPSQLSQLTIFGLQQISMLTYTGALQLRQKTLDSDTMDLVIEIGQICRFCRYAFTIPRKSFLKICEESNTTPLRTITVG
jgi:hypothetical protein